MLKDAIALVHQMMPKINPVVGEGIAYHQMRSVEQIVDKLMKIAFRREEVEWTGEGLPDSFRYVSYEPVSPEESYMVKANYFGKRNKGRSRKPGGYNMAQTDTYLVRYIFENDGDKIIKNLALPFVRRGGIIHINGTRFGIMAVLKTRGLSLTPKGYFAGFPRLRVIFDWKPDSFMLNGDDEHVYMPYSTTLHNSAKNATTYVPPLACWLFAKFGLFGAFEKFLGVNIKVYTHNDPELLTYDTEKYAICKPNNSTRNAFVDLAVVIAKEDLTPQAKIFITTIFYVARKYPTRITPEYIDSAVLWKIMLGFSIFGKGEYETRIVDEINTHFYNIERMLDVIFKKELLSEGIDVDTIYDFLFYVITRITQRNGDELVGMANLWGRYYTTTDYVIRDLREAIFNTHWQLFKLARKSGGKPIATTEVNRILNNSLKTFIINDLNNDHGEVVPFMTASDSMLIGLTSHCIDQTDAKKRCGRGRVIDLTDPQRHLHASYLEVGCVANLPKSNPIGWGRINSHVKLDPYGKIIPKEYLKEELAELAADIRCKGI